MTRMATKQELNELRLAKIVLEQAKKVKAKMPKAIKPVTELVIKEAA